MNKKEFHDAFEAAMEKALTEAGADELATKIVADHQSMLMCGIVKNLARLAQAQKEQSEFLNSLKPMIEFFVEKAKATIAEEEGDKATRTEVKKLRREQEIYELRKAAARRAKDGSAEDVIEREAAKDAEREARRQKIEDERDRRYALAETKPRQGLKVRIAQILGPKYPNLHVGNVMEIKYLDCLKAKEDDWHAETKIVLEQGLILTMGEWRNLIENEVLVVD